MDKQEHCPEDEVDEALNMIPQVPSVNAMIVGVDYYHDGNGRYVLTAEYLLKRGSCCHQGCKHCPYASKK